MAKTLSIVTREYPADDFPAFTRIGIDPKAKLKPGDVYVVQFRATKKDEWQNLFESGRPALFYYENTGPNPNIQQHDAPGTGLLWRAVAP